jgi:predicted DNA-binding WGR domain protein
MLKLKLSRRKEVLTTSENPVTILQHTKGRSAEYKIAIIQENPLDPYKVVAIYSKIGTAMKLSHIGSFKEFQEAKKLYSKKVQEKLKKGYEIINNKL